MRTDPTDTGGMFLRRRPGTAPVHYEAPPLRGSERRRRADAALAFGLLTLMTGINLLFWGPIPIAWLWVAGQIDYRTSSTTDALAVAFAGILATLLGALMIEKRLDQAWIVVRRAAGHDQRTGMLGRIFATTALIGAAAFGLWLLIIHGPGPIGGPSGGV
jgi:uncharacterized iron-regulated membrane protein